MPGDGSGAAPLPTHLVLRPGGNAWAAAGRAEAARRERDGWTVVRVIPAVDADHPLRTRILDHLMTVPEDCAIEIARRLDEPLGKVSYHVRALASSGAIVPTRKEQRRGAFANFYALSADASG